jgi:hypothetical protein
MTLYELRRATGLNSKEMARKLNLHPSLTGSTKTGNGARRDGYGGSWRK